MNNLCYFFSVCGSDLEIIASMAGSWNIPIISPSGSSSAIATNKTEFPTLTNMAFTMDKFALFYMDIFKFYKWKDIVIIYQLDQPLIKLLTDDLNEVFIKGNITTVMMPFAYGVNDFKPLLMKASKHSRGIVLTSKYSIYYLVLNVTNYFTSNLTRVRACNRFPVF